jgi:F-box and WD-40 domain protein CDC4
MALDSDVLVTGGSDARIIIWSLQDYTALHTIPEAHQYGISSMSARDGQILTGGSDGTAKLWDIKTGQLIGDLGTRTQSIWTVSLGAAETKTVILASAQGTSPPPEWDDAFLDVSGGCPMFTFYC